MPTQMLGRLLMKKFTQWSGAITMIASGLAAFMRSPSSVIERLRLSWFAALTSFQPRTMSGAWLEANTPTSLAMARPRGGFRSGIADLLQELRLGHPDDDEVEPQQVGIDPRREEHHVVALDRLAHLGLQGIAVGDLRASGAILRAQGRGALEIEEQLAQPVVSHALILPRSRLSCVAQLRRSVASLGCVPSLASLPGERNESHRERALRGHAAVGLLL